MPITLTVGTARNFSTVQACLDDTTNGIPATLGDQYTIDVYNDLEYTAGFSVTKTTTAVNKLIIRAAAGQSFQDHANKATNPLIYDQTKGVGFAVDIGFGGASPFQINSPHVDVERIQFKYTGTQYNHTFINYFDGNTNLLSCVLRDCIIQKSYNGTAAIVNIRGQRIVNCAVIDTGTGAATGIAVGGSYNSGFASNCTVVKANTAAGTGVTIAGTGAVVKNCAVFGWTTQFSGTGAAGSGYNGTSAVSAPGTNNQTSLTFANQFESVTADFRLKAGANLIGTGNTDATYAPNDIIGTVRGVGTAGDIGAWEAGSAANYVPLITHLARMRRG